MLLKKFEDLAPEFQNEDVKKYYDVLKKWMDEHFPG